MSGVAAAAAGAAAAAAAAAAGAHNPRLSSSSSSSFRNCPIAAQATSILDGVPLVPTRVNNNNGNNINDDAGNVDINKNDTDTKHDVVIMPLCHGLPLEHINWARLDELYAMLFPSDIVTLIPPLFMARKKTEKEIGFAIQDAIRVSSIIRSRQEVFITTKHWRPYHGYQATLKCLNLSLRRLQVDCIDLWLMHWPGPTFHTMARRKDVDPWNYAVVHDKTTAVAADSAVAGQQQQEAASSSPSEQMVQLRAETWRAMEHAYRQGKVRAIGVSNFSIQHLETLEKTATIRPMVNQVELHPLHPQDELVKYCHEHGIIVQAYASMGGQDAGVKVWKQLLGGVDSNRGAASNSNGGDHSSNASGAAKRKRSDTMTKKGSSGGINSSGKCDLLHAPAVISLAEKCRRQPHEQENSSSSSGKKYTTRNKNATTSSSGSSASNSNLSPALVGVTPAQVLLRWALERNIAILPKATSIERMRENTQVLDFHLTPDQVQSLSMDLLKIVRANNHNAAAAAAAVATDEAKQDEDDDDDDNDNERNIQKLTRLCWIRDPFRHLEFD